MSELSCRHTEARDMQFATTKGERRHGKKDTDAAVPWLP